MIMYLPPNLTSRFQPADMGVITSLKVGYKILLLRTLLDVFDQKDGFKKAERARLKRPKGCRGMLYGGKPTVLDAMNLLVDVWADETKYCTTECIQRCWRKADILPVSINADINNSVGSATLPVRDKTITPAQCKELCDLLGQITLICKTNHLQNEPQPPAIRESLMDDQGEALSQQQLNTVIKNWIEVEDDPVIIACEIEEALEGLEKMKLPKSVSIGGDEDRTDDDDDDDGVNTPMEIEESVEHRCISDFFDAEAQIDAVKSFVKREGYPQTVLDRLSAVVHEMRSHRSKKMRKDTTLHRYGF
jgi:hypothetical protein